MCQRSSICIPIHRLASNPFSYPARIIETADHLNLLITVAAYLRFINISSALVFFFRTIGGPLFIPPPGRGPRGGKPAGPAGGGGPDPDILRGPVGALTGSWSLFGNPDLGDRLSWLCLGTLALSELLLDSSRFRLASAFRAETVLLLIVGIVCSSSCLSTRRWRALSRWTPN